MSKLRKEIEEAINRNSAENESNTPDFILAEYLVDCLNAFDKAVARRTVWYGGYQVVDVLFGWEVLSNDKEKLINGLHRQIEIMESNAAYLHKIYPDLNHHIELMGAAKIMQDWLDNIDVEFLK